MPLRDGEDAMLVNWIGLQIRDAKGRVKYSSAWVTSLPVTKHSIAGNCPGSRAGLSAAQALCEFAGVAGQCFDDVPALLSGRRQEASDCCEVGCALQ